MKSTKNIPDWTNLPSELLELILLKLYFNFVDLIHFRAVCKSWHSISPQKPPNQTPPQLPWLMISSPETTMSAPFRFFSLSDATHYSLPPPSRASTCCGSSNGWLLMIDNDIVSSLLNPLTSQEIILPCMMRSFFPPDWCERFINNLPKQYLRKLIPKAVLSSRPHNGCFVMTITRDSRRHLMFCKVGGHGWKVVRENNGSLTHQPYEDVIYFKGKFYAVDIYARIVVCNLTGSWPFTEQIKSKWWCRADNTYLVELSGELVFIARFVRERSGFKNVYKTIAFQLFREDPGKKEWIEVEDIGDHAIFLGFNHSISLLATNYSGCRGNCIYFTDDRHFKKYDSENYEPYDCGIFNLEDGLVEPLPGYSDSELTQPPIWVTTSPW